FARAAKSLGAGALIVNPRNISEISNAIQQALTMPAEEREKRHLYNFDYVTSHTARHWAEFFTRKLTNTVIEATQRIRKNISPPFFSEGINTYLQSENRLLIL
ncbi:Alpha-alpha-trehalose-phosphate synthase, partial [Striga hermonthica]